VQCGKYNNWLQAVIDHCLKLNEGITEPLQYNEIKSIAKSISRYCWKKDAYHYQEFIQRQVYKGALGGRKGDSSNGGKARSALYDEKRKRAKEMLKQGFCNKEISLELNISVRTLQNWKKL